VDDGLGQLAEFRLLVEGQGVLLPDDVVGPFRAAHLLVQLEDDEALALLPRGAALEALQVAAQVDHRHDTGVVGVSGGDLRPEVAVAGGLRLTPEGVRPDIGLHAYLWLTCVMVRRVSASRRAPRTPAAASRLFSGEGVGDVKRSNAGRL